MSQNWTKRSFLPLSAGGKGDHLAHITRPRRAYSSRFIFNISHIFVTNWPSIPKLGKVMDKDTLFHGQQKMLIDV